MFLIYSRPSDNLEEMANEINTEKSNSKPKRLEENYKLVFKKALKFLLSEFKYKHSHKDRKILLEQKFYDHYFKEAFEKEGLSDEFYLSGTKDK
jgi:hypothetical protein